MQRSDERTGRALLARVFWLPAAALVCVEVYASRFDGWGAWATAPLFLIPFLLSLAIAAAGLRDALSEARSGGLRASTLIFWAIAAGPCAWLLVRRHVL